MHPWFLGLDEKFPRSADPERVIDEPVDSPYPDRILVDHVLIELRVTLVVIDVPAERLEERIDVIPPYLGLDVLAEFVRRLVKFEALDESAIGLRDRSWSLHATASTAYDGPLKTE